MLSCMCGPENIDLFTRNIDLYTVLPEVKYMQQRRTNWLTQPQIHYLHTNRAFQTISTVTSHMVRSP